FCAIEITRYLKQFIVQLRTLLASLTLGSILLLLAAAAYPFFPRSQLLVFLTVLGGVTSVAIVIFLIRLNRAEMSSWSTSRPPNRFPPAWVFVEGTAKSVLPILAAFTVQFPFVTSTLRTLLDPLFHLLK